MSSRGVEVVCRPQHKEKGFRRTARMLISTVPVGAHAPGSSVASATGQQVLPAAEPCSRPSQAGKEPNANLKQAGTSQRLVATPAQHSVQPSFPPSKGRVSSSRWPAPAQKDPGAGRPRWNSGPVSKSSPHLQPLENCGPARQGRDGISLLRGMRKHQSHKEQGSLDPSIGSGAPSERQDGVPFRGMCKHESLKEKCFHVPRNNEGVKEGLKLGLALPRGLVQRLGKLSPRVPQGKGVGAWGSAQASGPTAQESGPAVKVSGPAAHVSGPCAQVPVPKAEVSPPSQCAPQPGPSAESSCGGGMLGLTWPVRGREERQGGAPEAAETRPQQQRGGAQDLASGAVAPLLLLSHGIPDEPKCLSLADELAMYDVEDAAETLAPGVLRAPSGDLRGTEAAAIDDDLPDFGRARSKSLSRARCGATSSGEEKPLAPRRCYSAVDGARRRRRSSCREFDEEFLRAATNNWSRRNVIGEGRFGTVYLGKMAGCHVAIKRLESQNKSSAMEYVTEVEVLSRARHPNMLLLMGHCPETKSLVYEYMPGGSLHEYLGPSARKPLHWMVRVSILENVASALLYLHKFGPPIVHRDLKPQNIMLSCNFQAKVGDAGLARLLEKEEDGITARISGTFGYIDPEMMTSMEVSPTNDIYAFGAVCLQLLIGEQHVARVHRLLDKCADEPKSVVMSRTVKAFVERADVSAGDWPPEVAAHLAALGFRCVSRKPDMRPDLELEVLPVLGEMLSCHSVKGCLDV